MNWEMVRLTDDLAAVRRLYARPLATLPDIMVIDIAVSYRHPNLSVGRYYGIMVETEAELSELDRFLKGERPAAIAPRLARSSRQCCRRRSDHDRDLCAAGARLALDPAVPLASSLCSRGTGRSRSLRARRLYDRDVRNCGCTHFRCGNPACRALPRAGDSRDLDQRPRQSHRGHRLIWSALPSVEKR